MAEHEVLIVGAGPTGLMLAAELRLQNIDVAIFERRANQEITGSRAGGLHARTIEVLDQRGVADRFLSAGTIAQTGGFAWMPLDISDFPTRHNYGLGLWQNHIERILAEWIDELGVTIYRSREVTGFKQDMSGVDVMLAEGEQMRAAYLVGCDGGRSIVRKTAEIEFPGWDASISNIIAEVEMAAEPKFGLHRDAHGLHGLSRMENGPIRVLVTERQLGLADEPSLKDLSDALVDAYGTDFGVHSPASISRFTDMARQAATYRKGRVLLAGDAAHVHYPTGGQGLNTGVQDAVNLGWKLAQVLRNESPESLLDTYHAERHPVAARVLQNTMAQVALLRTDERTDALRAIVGELLKMDGPRKYLAGMLTGMDIHYDLGAGHPLLGRRMPDLDIATARGRSRVYAYLHDAQHVVFNFGRPGALERRTTTNRVQFVDVQYDGEWELPVIGSVASPTAVLVRPDGHVAWVGEQDTKGLGEALAKWCGFALGDSE